MSAAFIVIDYHRRYSVDLVLDPEGRDLAKGRIEHYSPQDWTTLTVHATGPQHRFDYLPLGSKPLKMFNP